METINSVFCILYILIVAASVYLYFRRNDYATTQININNVSFSRIYTIMLPVAVILLGAALRFYQFASVPSGLHQDEASIGYESYILAEYGVDRDGHTYPVYPVTYGSGGGSPLMIHLNVLTTVLLGKGVKTLRLLPVVLGAATLIVFFLMIRTLSADSLKRASSLTSISYVRGEYLWIPLVSLSILAFCPWHIMLSRWSLDSNITPFFASLAMLFFALGAYHQKESASFAAIGMLFSSKDRRKSRLLKSANPKATLFFALSAIMYALCLYSYGSALFVIPLHLIIISVFCIKTGRMNVSQLILGIILLFLFSVPLLLVFAVNYLGLPAIETSFFSITAFTSARSVFSGDERFLIRMWHSLIAIIRNITVGNPSEQIVNYIPGFPPLYAFTFPITLLGIICSAARCKKGEILDIFMAGIFLPAFIFGLFIEEDINRMVMMFLPLIYYLARGFVFCVTRITLLEKNSASRYASSAFFILKAVAPALFFIGVFYFLHVYFTHYNSMNADAFMPGYGEACAYADSCADEDDIIYSTYEHVSAPFMIALYYTGTSPYDFASTVHYKDPDAEFRIADSFCNFVFGLPEDTRERLSAKDTGGDVFILHSSELDGYEISGYRTEFFGDFVVLTSEG